LKQAKKLLPYINIGEENMGMAEAINEKRNKENPSENDQTKSSPRPLAPARIQFLPSSLILCMITEGKEDLLLKTRSFRSFQISQEISMMAVRRPLGEEMGTLAMACQ
jgi:hypothetical protein